MKKLLFAFSMFITMPLYYIGDYWVIEYAQLSGTGAAKWLGVFGAIVMIFQMIMSFIIAFAGYIELFDGKKDVKTFPTNEQIKKNI